MDELIKTFHIDWKLMIAQVVNFGLVFAALYFIAAKPLSKLVKDRTEEINTGLDNAKKAETELAQANQKKEEIVKEAREHGKQIVARSEADSKEIVKEAKTKAEGEREEIIKQAKLDADKEKKNAGEAVRQEASGLVAEGVKKIIEGYVAEGHGDKIIQGMLHK